MKRSPFISIYSAILATLSLALVSNTLANPNPTQEAKQKAISEFQLQAARLKLKYIIALEKLQKSLTISGDLDGGIAVKAEIERATDLEQSLELNKPAPVKEETNPTSK